MNILVLTSNYKSDDLPKEITPVVHYLVKEWVVEGHNVIVLHSQTCFPWIVSIFLKIFNKILANKVGYSFVTKKVEEIEYIMDGVKVYRRNMLKLVPHTKYLSSSYKNQLKNIYNILNSNKFVPDIIVGHWLTPQLKLLNDLKLKYKKPTCLVVHEALPILERDYPKKWESYLDNIDLLGFRSKSIKELFIKRYEIQSTPSFMCYSGIPECFLSKKFHKQFSSNKTYTFVGNLIQRKYPDSILYALNSLPSKKWIVNYIGDGYLKHKISEISEDLNIKDRVFIRGRLSRECVKNTLKETDVFIMISEGETFGLVYLEAMANGCITIGSKNEGIDGIIEDGVNGFLCKSGDVNELEKILKKIDNLPECDLMEIAYNGFLRARDLTDYNVSMSYLRNLETFAS